MKNCDILRKKTERERENFTPEFFRLQRETDREKFESLLSSDDIYLHDELYDQLKELLKCRNPRRPLSAEDYQQLIAEHIGNTDMFEYGVWVYYPWTKRLVHILDEQEFIEVRTSRNQYKITNSERDLLATKKVGVIGLSVGQSVSVTMAMERGCGELRLADFDVLELTNYNRIRTGLHNLGIKKVVAVAREIMELDPYLVVKCYDAGITEDNIDSFLDDGTGKLDLLIDECDSVDIKILCRIKAKEANIPVLMEASDRGTIDVERFDLEPERPILHGRIQHLDLSKLKHMKSYEEKVPYILPIAGTDTLSTRMKASMLEIGTTITTWPQLASAVALGGGITADVARRIFLDEYHESGRYFIDVEQLIADTKPEQPAAPASATLADSEIDQLIEEAGIGAIVNDIKPDLETISELVAAGAAAPSRGNMQPWKWVYRNHVLYLFLNETGVTGITKKLALASLGAAGENIVLKAYELGWHTDVILFPINADSPLVCTYRFSKADDGTAGEVDSVLALSAAIPLRSTNRSILLERKDISHERLQQLADVAATVPGASLQFLTANEELTQVSELIARAERIRLMDQNGHEDFVKEMIWEGNEDTNRGVSIDALQLRPSEKVAYNMAKNKNVVNYLNKWNVGSALEWFSRKYTLSVPAIGLLTMPGDTQRDFYEGGRALERVWLAATNDKLAMQPLNTLLVLFDELHKDSARFSEKAGAELSAMRKDFERLFALNNRIGEIMLFRVFINDEQLAVQRSPRVPVSQVLSF